LSFALISSDESQSKAKFNLQSLGEKKTSYRAENRFFPKVKTSSPHLLTLIFYTLRIMHCYAKQYWFATNYNFSVTLLLVHIMFPSELCQ